MGVADPRCYAFDDFRVDVASRQMRRRDGSPVALTPRVFDTLLYLLQHRGEVVGKESLMAAVWPGRIVEENNLNQNISALRRVFGATAGDHRYIVTEPGRGYRFVAEVVVDPDDKTAVLAETGDATLVEPDVAQSPRAARPRQTLIVTATLAALLILSVVAAWQWRSHRTPAPHTTQTIAVLPFRPLNANERDEAFELGMADALIGRLSRFSHVAVASLNSVRTFDRLDQDPLAAGRELGAGAVLEGHMQRNGELIHVTVRLLGVSDGTALWTGSFDEKFDDVFVVQDAIADKVSSALSLSIDGGGPVANTHFTRDIEAYKLYVAGRYHMAKPTADELHASIDFFRKAIDRDPSYALAYAGLADAYRRLPMVADEEPKAVFPLARAAASKALEIDDSLADAHSSMGWIACWFDWDWAASEREFQRAIALNPNISEAHLGYMTLLGATGRRAGATREGRRALELDPLSPLIRALAASSLGNPAVAEQELRKSLAIDPDFWVTHFALGGTAIAQGRVADSIAEYTKAKNFSNGNLVAVASLGYVVAKSGDTVGAETMLEDLLARSKDGYIPPVTIASIYSGLGDAEQTIAWLERAYDAHDVRLSFIQGDPRWNFLRKDPRFMTIGEKMGLSAAAKADNIE